ncbi:MAG: hypothetical protein N3A68_03065 [Bacteroidia bacterium]|nr:hypothetical protein [Bacteroidia bacterium]
MWRYVLGLAWVLLWAQDATAWRWQYTVSEGTFEPTPVPIKGGIEPNHALYGKTLVARDTIYSLVTLKDTGGPTQALFLPPTSVLNLTGVIPAGRSFAAVLVSTRTGAFCYAVGLYATDPNADIYGVDFVVDTTANTLYLLSRLSSSSITPSGSLNVLYLQGGLSSYPGPSVPTFPEAAVAVRIEGIGTPSLSPTINWLQVNQGQIFPYALAYDEDDEVLFLGGTITSNPGAGATFQVRVPSPPAFNGTLSNAGVLPLSRGFVMRCDANHPNLAVTHILFAENRTPPATFYSLHGRNLWLHDGQLLWLTDYDHRASNILFQIHTSGGYTSGGWSLVSASKHFLLLWPLDTSDLSPLGGATSPPQFLFEETSGASGPPAPPAFYASWAGDTLTLAWSDTLSYSFGAPVNATFSGNRLYVTQWQYAGGAIPSLQLLRVHAMPAYPSGTWPVLTGLLSEGPERLYWTGYFTPNVPGSLSLTPTSARPLWSNNQTKAYLAGLHWPLSASMPRLTGMHLLRTRVGAFATWYGIGRDRYGHFYGWGAGRDTLYVGPTYPAGADTAKGFGTDRKMRYWLGRLDWYRLHSIGPTGSTCAPDLWNASGSHRLYGSFPQDSGYLLVWMPEDPRGQYPLAHHWQWIGAQALRWPTDTSEVPVTFSTYLLPGRMPPGRYFLTGVVGGPWLPHFADVLDTVWVNVTGTTTPQLYEKDPPRLHFVTRFIGSIDPSYPYAHTGTYPMRQVRFEGQLRAITSVPWQAFAGEPPSEMLYILEETSDSVRLYRANLTNETIRPIRRWRKYTGSPTPPTREFGLDTVLATNAPGTMSAPFQLVWDPQSGRLLLGEKNTRIRAINPYSDRDALVLSAREGSASINTTGYPRKGGYRPFNGGLFVVGAHGELALFASNAVLNVVGFFRLTPDSRDSFLLRVGGNTSPPSNCDGRGTQARIWTVQAATLVGDTVWFIDRPPGGVCGSTGAELLLRRAYPSAGDPRRDTVETVDTLRPSLLGATDLQYRSLPTPHLLIAVGNHLMRYHIATQQKDTLWGCASNSCCRYGVSETAHASSLEIAPLRSGAIAAVDGGNTVRLYVPLYCPSEDKDTLLVETTIASTSGPFTPNGSEIAVSLPSISAGSGLFSLAGGLDPSSCSASKELHFYGYRLPVLSLRIEAPDTVCEGMTFHTFAEADTTGTGYAGEEGCPLALPTLTSTQGQVSLIADRQGGVLRWRATSAGYDTLEAAIPARLSCFFGSSLYKRPIRVRTGHVMRLRVLTEGPWRPAQASLRPHPLLSQRHLIRYALAYPDIASDSLWRLPTLPAEKFLNAWFGPLDPTRLCVDDPTGAGCISFTQPYFAQVVRIELRESPTGPTVDTLYGLIDSMGRIYPFWAAAYPFGSTQDTLYFCHCDVSTPKWIVVRFPNHLPLRTGGAISLSTVWSLPTLVDMRDPSAVDGVPGVHYALVPDSTVAPPVWWAAAWAGNCSDTHNSFVPGPHYDTGVINAADYEFLLPRQGVVGPNAFSWADLDNDGSVTAADALMFLRNQNALRQSTVSD